jgi:hypothetical protein
MTIHIVGNSGGHATLLAAPPAIYRGGEYLPTVPFSFLSPLSLVFGLSPIYSPKSKHCANPYVVEMIRIAQFAPPRPLPKIVTEKRQPSNIPKKKLVTKIVRGVNVVDDYLGSENTPSRERNYFSSAKSSPIIRKPHHPKIPLPKHPLAPAPLFLIHYHGRVGGGGCGGE